LLGPYRYRSERFLVNHLQRGKDDVVEQESADPLLTGYYLVNPKKASPISDSSDRDEEFEVASLVISEVKGIYGGYVPDGASRSSHWLAIAAPKIIQRHQLAQKASCLFW